MPPRRATLLCALLAVAGCRQAAIVTAAAPRQLHITGSSATYPFSAAAAERFTREDANAIAPLTQADGSGSGILRFCGRPGPTRPDIIGLTRTMTTAEQARCDRDGIGAVTTIRFGWSALVLATRPETPPLALTREDLRRALTGTAAGWRTIDPRLPDLPLRIDGPTPTAAIADGLGDIIGSAGCGREGCVRRDGRYRGHGASAPLALAAMLAAPPGAVALVPWSYAAARGGSLRLVAIDGVLPTAETIANGRYPLRLPLMIAVRTADALSLPSLRTLIALYAQGWTSDDFARRGLVPGDDAARAIAARKIAALTHRQGPPRHDAAGL